MNRAIKETLQAYEKDILGDDKELAKNMLRAALENVERATRHEAACKAFAFANEISRSEG